jgi:DNA-binding transcriptional LysR family regulator
MSQLQAMRVFACVVDLGSIHLADKRLGMSAAAVTCTVGMREVHPKMRLLNRTNRGLSVAETGKGYLDGCREIIGKLDATRDPSGTLRIAEPMTFVTSGLGALLASYCTLHPLIDCDATDFDTHVDMVEGGYDACSSDDRRLASAMLVSRRLTSIDEMVVASPDVPAAARHAAPDFDSLLWAQQPDEKGPQLHRFHRHRTRPCSCVRLLTERIEKWQGY